MYAVLKSLANVLSLEGRQTGLILRRSWTHFAWLEKVDALLGLFSSQLIFSICLGDLNRGGEWYQNSAPVRG